VADSIAALGVEYVGINFSYLSDTLYQKFRERGLGVGAWTVNTAKDIKHIASMGVDFITSDRPDLLTELLQ
jgi:glycerophosphoryl diester phosphodiesterase